MNLTLEEITRNCQLSWQGKVMPGQLLNNVSTDSRTVGANDLFVALQGDQFDGHAFVEQAFAQGAVAALVNSAWAQAHPQENLLVADDTLTAIQQIAKFYCQKFNVKRIALTGSAGKTTCKEFLFGVLAQQFRVHRNLKSFNNHIGVPITLLGLQPEHEVLITELGTNHFGEIDLLSSLVQPQISILLNIGYAHLAYFQDRLGVAKAKMEILNHTVPNGIVFYNVDDDLLAVQDYHQLATRTFGVEKLADIQAHTLACDQSGCYAFFLNDTQIKLNIPGRHNVYNALAAAAVGLHLGLSVQQIKSGLESLKLVDRRMDVFKHNDLIIMNDVYNANPGSCRAALATGADIQLSAHARRIAVFADMLELGDASAKEHTELASQAKNFGFDALYLFGNETRNTMQAAEAIGFSAWHFTDKTKLTAELQKAIQPGDLILVKGSRSMHMEDVVNALTEVKG